MPHEGRPLAYEPPNVKQVPAARLFRLLSNPERPGLPIDFRLTGAEAFALEVRAPTSREFSCALDQEGDDPDGQDAAQRRALIASVLWTGGGRAFRASGSLGLLYGGEFDALWGAVWGALDVIAPSSARSNLPEWLERLKEGALHALNLATARQMAETRELDRSLGYRLIWLPRPERYYGKAPVLLTEGQLLAYRAACEAVDS